MKINLFGRQYDKLNKPLKNFMLLFLLVAAIIITAGLYYYNYQKESIIAERYDNLHSISDYKMRQIEQWLHKKYSDLNLAKAYSPVSRIGSGNNIISTKVFDEIKSWFELISKEYDYDDIILVGSDLKTKLQLSAGNHYLSNIDSSLSVKCMDADSIYFSDSDYKTSNQNELKFYVPIKTEGKNGRADHVVILILEPLKNFDRLLNVNVDKSPTMESLLVKSFGDSVLYLNQLKYSNGMNGGSLKTTNKALLKTGMIKDRKGFVDAVDYLGNEVIAVIANVPSTAWFMITKMNKREFFKPVNDQAKIIFFAVTSAVFLFAIVLFFVWRKNIVTYYIKMYETETEKTRIEKRFESLVNGVKDIAIFILDTNGNILSWNEGAEKIKGYKAGEIIGKNYSVLFDEEDLSDNLPEKNLRNAVDSGSFQTEGWRVRKDGTLFWANTVITSLKDENEKVYGFLKITRDMTQIRLHDEELKKSRDFYLKLLDDFPNPVWRSDLDGTFNYFNKAWLKFTGATGINESRGWVSQIHTDDKVNFEKEFKESIDKQKNFALEYRLKDASGYFRWMINFGIPFFDIENKFAGYLGSCYDIDDRKNYEHTINTLLRIIEKLYSSLEIDQILDSLVMESINLTGAESGFACIRNEDYFNVKRYFHKDHWEFLEMNYSVEDEAIKRFEGLKNNVLFGRSDSLNHSDTEIIGKYKVHQILSSPLFGSGGELLGFFEIHNKKTNSEFSTDDANLILGVAKNASVSISKSLNYEMLRKTEAQLRSSEAELRKLTAQIQYAREAERQTLAREVHDELGQLFTGINLNISLLTEMIEGKNKPSSGDILKELYSVQDIVNKGIKSVRDISGSLRSYVLDHLGLIPALQEYCREIERISSLKCEFNSEVEELNLNDDKNVALFRIVQEALTNVIRHAEASEISVNIKRPGKTLKIEIADNGKGMSETESSSINSMGILGMKERAIFLGGKLDIEKNPGHGTKIFLSIPN